MVISRINGVLFCVCFFRRCLLVVGSVNHPFHLHGNPFVVIGMGQHPDGVPMTLDRAYELDRTNRLNRNLQNLQPPIKDTISIPSRGYAVIRVLATNPGE